MNSTEIDFGKIVNRAFEIAWQFKWLWLFGMLVYSNGFNMQYDLGADENPFGNLEFDPQILTKLVSLYLGIAILVVTLAIIGLIAQGGIIESINRIERGGKLGFGEAFSAGLNNFFKMFGLTVLAMLSFVVVIAVTIVISVVFFKIHVAMGILSLLITIPGALFLGFVLFNLLLLSEQIVVIRRASIADGIEEAYYLMKQNFSKILIVFLIFIGLHIAAAIGVTIFWVIFNLPVAAIFGIVYKSVLVGLLVSFIVGLPFSYVLGGIAGVFFTAIYTLFYLRLVDPNYDRPSQAIGGTEMTSPV